ncbi:hypothetical protein PPTG_22180 [Phytophthora nicotianae INRA-310]|uniref:Uncharacterized protein n=1 Tax=Phytophthora nicotianae (strain INRA-310) TaxID=761204 RepID=W2QNC4_PHYN3|nr:hypothetical protein PPTG_22180 [Phytophthora nicotianae INRA-310]ETN14692.1 hypothetical protein PPTG_22180 [Phytophthora nicotianae INRA-310]
MHGRVKSVEREKEKQKTDEQRQEELSKVRMYHEVAGKVLDMKRQQLYEPSVLPLTSHLLLLNPEFHVSNGAVSFPSITGMLMSKRSVEDLECVRGEILSNDVTSFGA